MSLSIIFVLAFLAICLVINKNNFGVKNFEDFATSRGSFGSFAVAMSVFASWYAGSVYVIWADFTVNYGFIGTYVLVYSLMMLIFFYQVSERTYLWGKKYSLKTQAELMDLRYRSKPLQLIISVVGICFTAPLILLEWVALGYIFYYATGGEVQPIWGMVIGAVVVLVYVSAGGMRSVVTANLLQGSYMFFVGTGLMFYLIYQYFGSFDGAMQMIMKVSPDVLTFPGPNSDVPSTYWASLIISSALGAVMWPFVFNKLLIADSVRSVKRSILIAPLMSTIFWVAFVLLGITLHTIDFARANPVEAYMWMAREAGALPLALFSTLVVAASVSSVAGFVQAISTCVSTDIAEVVKRDISDKQSIRIARLGVILISIITLYFASGSKGQLIYLALFSYQGIMVLFPVIMLGMFWKRANRVGALTSIFLGVPLACYLTYAQPAFVVEAGWTGGVYGFLLASVIMLVSGFLKPVEAHVHLLWADIEQAKRAVRSRDEKAPQSTVPVK